MLGPLLGAKFRYIYKKNKNTQKKKVKLFTDMYLRQEALRGIM